MVTGIHECSNSPNCGVLPEKVPFLNYMAILNVRKETFNNNFKNQSNSWVSGMGRWVDDVAAVCVLQRLLSNVGKGDRGWEGAGVERGRRGSSQSQADRLLGRRGYLGILRMILESQQISATVCQLIWAKLSPSCTCGKMTLPPTSFPTHSQ